MKSNGQKSIHRMDSIKEPFRWARLNKLASVNKTKVKEIWDWVFKHDHANPKQTYKMNVSVVKRGKDEPNRLLEYPIPSRIFGKCKRNSSTKCEGAVAARIAFADILEHSENAVRFFESYAVMRLSDGSERKYMVCPKSKREIIDVNDERVIIPVRENPIMRLLPISSGNTAHGRHRNNMVTQMVRDLKLRRPEGVRGTSRGNRAMKTKSLREFLDEQRKELSHRNLLTQRSN